MLEAEEHPVFHRWDEPHKESTFATPERIYISRNKANTRRFVNEEVIISFVALAYAGLWNGGSRMKSL
jgi:capsular polysaccharide biosynthesis protein